MKKQDTFDYARPKRRNSWQTNPEKMRIAHYKAMETRRKNSERRKALKEQFDVLLKASLSSDSDVRDALRNMGIRDEEMTNQMAIVLNMFLQASTGNGSSAVQAATFVRDTVGEKPKDTQVTVQTDFESYVQSLEDDNEF